MNIEIPREEIEGNVYSENELTYSATSRCVCGEGLAYTKDARPIHGAWYCSGILTGRTPPREQDPYNGQHAKYSFVFWEIKSEKQASAMGHTTRPKPQEENSTDAPNAADLGL
jgi:hypothetical protein